MKKIFILLTSVFMMSVVISCKEEMTASSEFNEFEIKCQDGTVRKGGIYLPPGIKSKDKLPVIYMADGLVFKECGFKRMLDSLYDCGTISPVVVACSYENKKTVPGYKLAFRNAEYIETLAKNDNTLAQLYENHYNFFIDEFIPYIEKKYIAHILQPYKKNPKLFCQAEETYRCLGTGQKRQGSSQFP